MEQWRRRGKESQRYPYKSTGLRIDPFLLQAGRAFILLTIHSTLTPPTQPILVFGSHIPQAMEWTDISRENALADI